MNLKARDTISGQEGTAYIEINGRNEEMFYVKSINATVEKNKVQLRTLGKRGDQNKTVGWSGSGSATIYGVTSRFVEMALDYVKNGRDLFVNIMVTNEDPTSTVGRQSVVLKEVNFDSYPITMLDVDAEALEQEMDFTFDDLDLLEKFQEPTN
ncbi:Phage tail tube protein [Amphibacillus marinus]|uniref:Phage tail tube protein n=1 Tax=Amphibacillus marinus TaxID=872970 RepID=A0A1H8IYZ9_9BACI|nr:phage tail tube protein [Amphibacillus marinus]SEN73661.1 Phage tail tube protein [Amphibacillus marinus]